MCAELVWTYREERLTNRIYMQEVEGTRRGIPNWRRKDGVKKIFIDQDLNMQERHTWDCELEQCCIQGSTCCT